MNELADACLSAFLDLHRGIFSKVQTISKSFFLDRFNFRKTTLFIKQWINNLNIFSAWGGTQRGMRMLDIIIAYYSIKAL